MNYGAWSYVRPRLENTMRSLAGAAGATRATGAADAAGAAGATEFGVAGAAGAAGAEVPAATKSEPAVVYVGRNPSAARATGLAAIHRRESDELLEAAFAE